MGARPMVCIFLLVWLVINNFDWQCFLVCRGEEYKMEFSIEVFRQKPSYEILGLCRKNDLYVIADFYDIPITKTARKKEVREVIEVALEQQGVLSAVQPLESDDANIGEGVSGGEQGSLSGLGTADLKLAIQLKQLDLEIKRQEHTTQVLRFRQCELETQAGHWPPSDSRHAPALVQASQDLPLSPASPSDFDVCKQINLVPPFREAEVDSYFGAFERIAVALRWPKEVWPLLLQCRLIGKAQEVCSALSINDSLNYEKVKSAVLRAYELVPEAYRQKFRSHAKTANQTFVEYAREKCVLFDKWCQSSKTINFEQLRELVLIEDFKNSLPDKIVVYLNEKKVSILAEAAVSADEFVLTHKNVFVAPARRELPFSMNSDKPKTSKLTKLSGSSDVRECFYCHEIGHLIAACPTLKKKNRFRQAKSVGLYELLVRNRTKLILFLNLLLVKVWFDKWFRGGPSPYYLAAWHRNGSVLHFRKCTAILKGNILWLRCFSAGNWDGSCEGSLAYVAYSFRIDNWFRKSGCANSVTCEGSYNDCWQRFSRWKSTSHSWSHRESSWCDFCLSKDVEDLTVFPACVITRAQSRKFPDVFDLSDSFLVDKDSDPALLQPEVSVVTSLSPVGGADSDSVDLLLSIDRATFAAEQKQDPSLACCRDSAVTREDIASKPIGYFYEDGVLMRKWTPSTSDNSGWDTHYQMVVPKCFREQVLSVAHDNVAGHLGVTKTLYRVMSHFFWPRIKSAVTKYCRSCHTCQMVGKPNQAIPPAPLKPIPVIGEPFERIIIDCVGPLPKTKSGHIYLLTIMCAATRYPEAIPLRSLRAKAIVKALTSFFSTFGLPKVVQTDQGTNFMSRLFNQILSQLHIQHVVSSAYHPESQGALERFHQTLKTMLKTYCTESEKEWDVGLPLLLFALRETVQESLGFSPAELVFGHTVRGPLKLLKENWLSDVKSSCNLLDYVSSFRERLHKARDLAQSALSNAQIKMKKCFDKDAVSRSFEKGDQVLVLLPLPGSALQAKFSGPYVVDRKLSDTDYIICTPDRQRKTRVCHINMLKRYVARGKGEESKSSVVPVASSAMVLPTTNDDGLCLRSMPASGVRLNNSEVLLDLNSHLLHLTEDQKADIVLLIQSFLGLFSDVPTQTKAIKHDIEVNEHSPIKQNAYRVNPAKRKVIESEVKYLMENGLAVPSSSAWSSPCLLVPKPDGSHRFCTDYRKVNAITKPDSFPLPLMEDCVDDVGSARFVTKLDLLKGYWQVPLTERAAEISAFVTPDNFLNYTVMAFGLRNAPATFQRLMNTILGDVANCKAYLDDIVVFSSSWREHVNTLFTVFTRLFNASLTLNLAKCEFAKATVTYLGKQVGQGQVRPVAQKVQAIVDFPVPQTKRELRRFLGMAGYYRAFCRNFSDVVLPLTNLLRSSQKFVWSDECQHAFKSVKALLCSAPVLSAPDYLRGFKIEVDASASGAGAVLLQDDDDGVEHPVAYFSKKFLSHQKNYSTIEKEALALLLSLQHFEVYVGSSSIPVLIFTDHNPLIFLSRMRNANQRLMRWSLFIQDFNLEICYKKGKDNVLADALSRSFDFI